MARIFNPKSGRTVMLAFDHGFLMGPTSGLERIDLNIAEPMANGFRFAEGLPLFETRIHVIPAAADDLKQIAQEKLVWLDGLMDGKDFVCGDRFTIADILLFAFLEFGASVGQPLDAKCERLQAWYARVAARPSVAG